MEHEQDDTAARELRAQLRKLADEILDLESCGRLLTEAPRLLKLLGDARSRVYAYEVRYARAREEAPAAPAAEESHRVVDEALQREREAEQEWFKPWERQGESEL